MILIKCFLYRHYRPLFCVKRRQQTLSQKTKANIYQGTKDIHGCLQGGEIFLSLLVKMFNRARCLSGLLVEILCFPLRSTNETVFLSVKHTMKSTKLNCRECKHLLVPLLTLCFKNIFSVSHDNGLGA